MLVNPVGVLLGRLFTLLWGQRKSGAALPPIFNKRGIRTSSSSAFGVMKVHDSRFVAFLCLACRLSFLHLLLHHNPHVVCLLPPKCFLHKASGATTPVHRYLHRSPGFFLAIFILDLQLPVADGQASVVQRRHLATGGPLLWYICY